jgi:hypothetical protein
MDIITRYFLAMAFMLSFIFIWYAVQKLSRKFASDHPEFGKAREEGGGCGGGGKCNCNNAKNCAMPNSKVKSKK